MTDGGGAARPVDFFVSYAECDRAWAEWVAWTLEDAGYRVLVQAWDFVPGSRSVVEVHAATRRAGRTVALLSSVYLESAYAAAEWQAAWEADPDGGRRKLLVLRVEDCDRPGLLERVSELWAVDDVVVVRAP